MDQPFLLQTKFLIPRHGGELIARLHLLHQLEEVLNKRLILLSAPPGYGKTILLSALASHVQRPVAWYQLDAADSDPAIFLSYLIACLRNIHSNLAPDRQTSLGNAAMTLLNESESRTTFVPKQVLLVLINELTPLIEGDWSIILEDFHLITNPEVHILVQTLLDQGPPNLHLIISSRTDPPLSLARLRASGKLAEFRAPQLRFSLAEVQRWLSQAVPGMDEESARLLSEKTEGWAAALQIALSSLSGKDSNSAAQFITELSGTQRFIFEYLAEEVLAQHPAQRQEFMLQTAVLEQMNASVCNAILGTDNAQLVLEKLEHDNLFIITLDDKREWFRYHHLFREFLLGKLRRENPEILIQLERATGSYYEQHNADETAFTYYIRARDYDAAALTLSRFAREYVERGRIAVIQRYIGEIPEETLSRNPELLLQHGNVLWRLGRIGAANSRFEEAQTVFNQHGDRASVCLVLTQMAELARSQGNYHQARSLAAKALTYVTGQDYASRANALMTLAKSEGFLTGMDRGRALAEESVDAARKAGDLIPARARATLLRSLGQICWWHGDPQATLRYCQEALESLSDRRSPAAAAIYITMAIPYVYRRDLDTAQSYAELGLEIAEQLQLPALLPRAYMTLGSILTRRGEFETGENYLRQALAQAHSLGLESYTRVMATGYLAQNLSSQRRLEEARQVAEAALWERAANPNTYEMVVCRSVLADVALDREQYDEAQTIFSNLMEIGQRRQFRIPLAMVYFGLAYIHLYHGRTSKAIDYAQKSVAILEPLGTWQLFLDQGDRARLICQALADAGQVTPFVNQVLQRLPIRTSAAAIQVKSLGPFRVFIGHEEVTQAQWVSTKARDLLAFFITKRRQHIPIEQVVDAIWPESGREKRAFHSALYRLRSALRPHNENAKFILIKGGECWLDEDQFQVDVDNFQAALARAKVSSGSERIEQLELALSYYKGDYLENMLYYGWADLERRRLHQQFLDLLAELASLYGELGQYQRAINLTEKAITANPYDEASYCELMRQYASLGDKVSIARQFQRLETVLQEELQVQPSPSTQQLVQLLLNRPA